MEVAYITNSIGHKVLFPVIPQTCDLERMKAGGEHWQWNNEVPFYIGVLPRRGASGSDVKVCTATLQIRCCNEIDKGSGSARQTHSQDTL